MAEARSVLEIWIDRAANAVWGFHRSEDGSFWTTSKVAGEAEKAALSPPPHITTTARAYVAIQNTHRAKGEDAKPPVADWVRCFSLFAEKPHMQWVDDAGGYYGLDQGIVVMMIENYRSGLIWNLMRSCSYIASGLRRAGFAGGWL